MDLKSTIARATKDARAMGKEMVVGTQSGNGWSTPPLDDSRSDQLSPGIIVTAKGIKYPEDFDLATRLMSEGQ